MVSVHSNHTRMAYDKQQQHYLLQVTSTVRAAQGTLTRLCRCNILPRVSP